MQWKLFHPNEQASKIGSIYVHSNELHMKWPKIVIVDIVGKQN